MKFPSLLLSFLLLSACGPNPVIPDAKDLPKMPPLVPKQNFFIRNSLDNDPSLYVGRFVSDGTPLEQIDEARAKKTECSKFYKIRKVGGGGVEYDEYFSVSSQAAASLGIPAADAVGLNLKAGGEGKAQRVIRVKYNIHEKMIADLSDPAAFKRCCRADDHACSGLVVGEFISGTGTMYQAAGTANQGELAVGMKGVGADLSVKNGIAWRQAIKFPQPVYFAFKLTEGHSDKICESNWATRAPRRAGLRYFIGTSSWIDDLRKAEEQAMLDARRQVIKFLGERIQEDSTLKEQLRGSGAGLESATLDETKLKRSSAGVARFVYKVCQKIDKSQGPNSWRYQVKVLSELEEKDLAQAAAAAAASL